MTSTDADEETLFCLISARDVDKPKDGNKEELFDKLEESVDDPVARDAIEQFAHPDEAGTSARPAKGG